MTHLNRIGLVPPSMAFACIALVACAGRAFSQTPIPVSLVDQQLMSTQRPSVQRDIKLGNDYLSGHGVGKDEKQAAYWYERAAEAGDPWAQQQIGFFYQAGIGVSADPARAAHWYQLAAAAGLASAKTNLGVAYMWGSGVPMDKQLAAQLFREAADKGDGRAATYLGNLFYSGGVLQKDETAAEHWYRIGAKLHDPVADYDLGLLYSTGDRDHDFVKAAEWLRRSVASGYVPAMHSLALFLENHPEMARSRDEALALFERASAYGQWKSSAALGIAYRDGVLVPRDPKTAYYYFHLAILQGAEKERIESILPLLAAELGTNQSTKIEMAAQAWYQQHHDAVELLLNKAAGNTPPGLAIVAPLAGIHAGQLVSVPAS